MDFEDKIITCEDCGKEFTHTADDQRRYAERGFTADPKRCRECRQARKDKAAAQPQGGGERRRPAGGGRPGGGGRGFGGPPRRPGGGGGGGGFPPRRSPAHQGEYGGGGGRGGGGGYGRGERRSFDAVCAACGTQTTVPFEPTPGREVFCRDCYRKLKEG